MLKNLLLSGGTDLGSSSDWVGAVTRQAVSSIRISAAGGNGNTSYRVSANFRDVEGILISSDFSQFNSYELIQAFNDKLSLTVNTAFTQRKQNNGSSESLKYMVLYNPTAPNYANYNGVFNGDQFEFFETLGLFDSYNPVSIAKQQLNQGDKSELNYSVNNGV